MYSMCMSHRKIQYEYVKKSHGVIFLLILPEIIFLLSTVSFFYDEMLPYFQELLVFDA
jgi:hypothetical protein